MNDVFHKIASKVSALMGSPLAFITALTIILTWGLTGPIFNFSNTWQLVINTSTTIVTFLMVFLIQNTQNRDAKAIHLKLDELLKSNKGASNNMIDAESLSDEELEKLHNQFETLHKKYASELEKRSKK